jgi:hypothetical protein
MTSATNHLPVGAEPDRAWAQFYTDQSASDMQKQLRSNPYRVVWLTNGAGLDSIGDSKLDQGPGSRAFYQEYGIIPGYDMDRREYDVFYPRGFAMLRQSIEVIKNFPK